MAQEFIESNDAHCQDEFREALKSVPVQFEPHLVFKKRVPGAIGLIRTGEARIYTNLILESA